ncbi:hypothetical protein GCM10009077_02340 [Roseibium denhamense]
MYLVPSASTDEATDNIGAFFRLGEYSQTERNAVENDHESELFPAQHIEDEDDQTGIYTNAAGGSQGIMLACDGRILVKAAERMYLETGDYHQKVNGDYTQDVEGAYTSVVKDNIDISSEDGQIKIQSANNKPLKLKAGDGSGKLEIKAKDEEKNIKGESEHTYHKWHTIKYKDSYESHKFGWDFNSIYGFAMTTYYGSKMESLYGLRMQFDKFNFLSDWVSFNWKGTQIDLKGIVMKKITAKFGKSDCSAEWDEIMVGLQGLKAEATRLEAKRKELAVQSGNVDLKNHSTGARLVGIECVL